MTISLLEPLGIESADLASFAREMESAGHRFTSYDQKAATVQQLIARSAGQEIIMIANTPYPKEAIVANPQIKMIAVAFTGVDHVDLEACRKQGIVVTNCAGYSDQAVAEHAVALALASLRKIVECDRATRASLSSASLMGSEIYGKRVGIIGYGRIGARTAALFSAFGAEVVVYTRKADHNRPETFLSLEQLLSSSDIISLHVPSTIETRHMIGSKELAKMKKGALLINCARGPVVDSAALSGALKDGSISAALDVFDTEPPLDGDDPLLLAANTVLTPHVAYLTQEAMVRRAAIEFENVRAYLRGEIQNRVDL